MIPSVSVVIPTYNYGRFLDDCLESVVTQTFADFEIIVVDDASTDDTPRIAALTSDRRIRYVRHDRNRGVAAAQNTGIDAARGDLVALLGADDLMEPDNLTRKVDVLATQPDVVLVHGPASPINESGMLLFKPRRSTGPATVQHLFPQLLYGNSIVASSVVMRRDALRAVGSFDTSLPYAEDWDLWVRLAFRSPFAYVPDPLVRLRVHASMQWTGFVANRDIEGAERILRKAFEQHDLAAAGYSFREIYWTNFYSKLGNKIELLPRRSLVALLTTALRAYPRGMLTPVGRRVSVRLAARFLLPSSLLLRLRRQRHARRLADA
jgi:glycosyltransferase involved in cell wall biosynthesis